MQHRGRGCSGGKNKQYPKGSPSRSTLTTCSLKFDLYLLTSIILSYLPVIWWSTIVVTEGDEINYHGSAWGIITLWKGADVTAFVCSSVGKEIELKATCSRISPERVAMAQAFCKETYQGVWRWWRQDPSDAENALFAHPGLVCFDLNWWLILWTWCLFRLSCRLTLQPEFKISSKLKSVSKKRTLKAATCSLVMSHGFLRVEKREALPSLQKVVLCRPAEIEAQLIFHRRTHTLTRFKADGNGWMDWTYFVHFSTDPLPQIHTAMSGWVWSQTADRSTLQYDHRPALLRD